ncbi:MAG TPA: Re/Si-specific NAD(P)(+) transhydrogenase subunit alpha [Candidatus Saccharimonadales bacterium]|nr:Re/Si-specific NAD(P)(+) transhydrogenase subunit alpha [Candidatus Saccharimonadales bacterium]
MPRETVPGERRVALVPEAVGRLTKAGTEVVVESGAGTGSGHDDEAYRKAGAAVGDRSAAFGADLVVKVQKPSAEEIALLREGATLIATIQPLTNADTVRALAARRTTAISMDAIPRVTRAQPMDSLSSQSNIAGYKAVVAAANSLPKFFPMLTTAAGTVTPARVLVLGAGVAGLQAIATARRLGAVVEAFDTRPVVKEQVQSLGAKFLEIELGEQGEGTGGYAKELSEEAHRKEQELVGTHVKDADVVITTALVPGRRAPILVTADMVKAMKPGSVIVDLAAEMGGNCELTSPGETVVKEGVTIHGEVNWPSTVSVHASQLYSRNVGALLGLLVKDGALALDREDEIVKGALITYQGEVVHAATKDRLEKA